MKSRKRSWSVQEPVTGWIFFRRVQAMYGKIIRIDEVYGYKVGPSDYFTMEGYEIITEKNKILVLIQDGQQCCEQAGYFSSEDDLKSYIGRDLWEVNLTDKAFDKIVVSEKGLDYAEIQFVDFVTDNGTFQLAVYNDHNGYYGHDIKVMIDDKVICEQTL
jgi:hypothetical protein